MLPFRGLMNPMLEDMMVFTMRSFTIIKRPIVRVCIPTAPTEAIYVKVVDDFTNEGGARPWFRGFWSRHDS
jgi:hypothetical protein